MASAGRDVAEKKDAHRSAEECLKLRYVPPNELLVFDPKARQLLAETGRIARFLSRFLPAGRLARIPNRDALPLLDNQHQLVRSPELEKFRRKLFRPETGR